MYGILSIFNSKLNASFKNLIFASLSSLNTSLKNGYVYFAYNEFIIKLPSPSNASLGKLNLT